MKLQSVILLLALLAGVMLPSSLPFLAEQGGEETIGVLDVCHSAAPALSSTGDMPCLHECRFFTAPPHVIETAEVVNPSVKQSPLSFQDERPPEA